MINSLEKITLGGMEQWLLIRGEKEELPVLLFLHGGPGFSFIPFAQYFQKLEANYIVVQWDQRGTGKSYTETIPPETMTAPVLSSTIKGCPEKNGCSPCWVRQFNELVNQWILR
jgi:pimeloyl-ACP methyl ester carboxylesterase